MLLLKGRSNFYFERYRFPRSLSWIPSCFVFFSLFTFYHYKGHSGSGQNILAQTSKSRNFLIEGQAFHSPIPLFFHLLFLEGGEKRRPFNFVYASTIPVHLWPSSGQEPGIREFSVRIRRLLSLFRSVALLKLPKADRSPARPLGNPSTLKMVPYSLPMNILSLFISSVCSLSREYSPQSSKRSPKSFCVPRLAAETNFKAPMSSSWINLMLSNISTGWSNGIFWMMSILIGTPFLCTFTLRKAIWSSPKFSSKRPKSPSLKFDLK